MKNNQLLSSNIFLWIVLICTIKQAYTQNTPNLLANTIEHTIQSSRNGKAYNLYVSLPKNYATTDSLYYPVLYVLDGKYSFNTFHSSRAIMNLGKELQDIIIVAIDNKCENDAEWLISRHYDLTPSNQPEVDAQIEKVMQLPEGKLKSGGAALFLNSLEKDFIPFIKKNYRTSKDQGISGHSLGGLFAAYSLIKKPSLFNSYGINSPSFWWNNNEMLLILNATLSNLTDLKAQVFFSIGALEGDMMLTPYETFLDSLRDKNLESLQISSQIFENETHLSVVPVSSTRTMKILYGI
jgi:hypothetical protein